MFALSFGKSDERNYFLMALDMTIPFREIFAPS
jgi:hypothetical protein